MTRESRPATHPVCLRLDTDIIDWFKAQGPRYQTQIKQVLRDHVAAQKADAS